MKKQFYNQFLRPSQGFEEGRRIFISALLLVCSTIFSFGQNQKSLVDRILKNPDYKNQWSAIEQMRKANVDDNKIMDYLEAQSKAKRKQVENITIAPNQRMGQPPVAYAACSGMGVESGWGAWTARTGTYSGGSISWSQAVGAGIAPTAPRFNLTSGAGTDACTPGPNPGDPTIPVVCPGFGNASIQIGQPQTSGDAGSCGGFFGGVGCAEELSYPLLVTAADTNFVYSYAVVIEDPGHPASDQPYVSLAIYDSPGHAITCGYFQYIAGGGLPGFYTASCNINSVTYYKPWTLVGINLKPYIAQTLTVVITNVDCGQGGHYAQAYFDFRCGTLAGNAAPGVCGAASSLCGPTDPQITYTYQWYQNGVLMPGSTSPCINPIVQTGDVFSVAVSQPSGCGFNLVFQPQSAITFTVTTNGTPAICGSSNGTATATATGSSGYTYSWNTTPAQTSTTATGLGAGTYSVTVTDVGGCTSTTPVTITTGTGPIATSSGTNPTCVAAGSATVTATGGTNT